MAFVRIIERETRCYAKRKGLKFKIAESFFSVEMPNMNAVNGLCSQAKKFNRLCTSKKIN